MITVTEILGTASEESLANRLHELEHRGQVEVFVVDSGDTLRRRLRGKTDKGTEIAIALDRNEQLADGSVLFLDETCAIVVRMLEQRWLRISPRDVDAALETGYCAGNHHWQVRFEPNTLLIAMEGPSQHYLMRLEHLVKTNRLKVENDE